MFINENIQQLMQLLRSKPNPQQFILGMLEQQNTNPFFNNLYQLAKNKDTRELEQIARNLVNERGLDFDTEFNSFKQMFGFKN